MVNIHSQSKSRKTCHTHLSWIFVNTLFVLHKKCHTQTEHLLVLRPSPRKGHTWKVQLGWFSKPNTPFLFHWQILHQTGTFSIGDTVHSTTCTRSRDYKHNLTQGLVDKFKPAQHWISGMKLTWTMEAENIRNLPRRTKHANPISNFLRFRFPSAGASQCKVDGVNNTSLTSLRFTGSGGLRGGGSTIRNKTEQNINLTGTNFGNSAEAMSSTAKVNFMKTLWKQVISKA